MQILYKCKACQFSWSTGLWQVARTAHTPHFNESRYTKIAYTALHMSYSRLCVQFHGSFLSSRAAWWGRSRESSSKPDRQLFKPGAGPVLTEKPERAVDCQAGKRGHETSIMEVNGLLQHGSLPHTYVVCISLALAAEA